MNKPRCQFDKRKNCVRFGFCSPSHKHNATPKSAVKGDLSFTLPLTVLACPVLQTKATGSKNKPNTARSEPYCSPEQRKKPKNFCGCVGGGTNKCRCGCVVVARGEACPPPPHAPLGFVSDNTHGWVLVVEATASITGGYLLTKPTKTKIKRRCAYD